MTVYTITLRTLTPVHIGDGTELRRDFDFVVKNKRTFRFNEDVLLEAKADQLVPDARGDFPAPTQLLTAGDYANPAFFRYIIPGVVRSNKTDAKVRAEIKDPQDRPYIPGSSLKGAFRTALAWTGWNEVKPELTRNAIGEKRSWAGQKLERRLFGDNPNHDLLRALRVSDLHGPQKPGEGLILVNAQVLTKKSAGSPVELEAIKSEQTFTGAVSIDETLFTPQAERELKFGNRRHWLNELMARAQSHSLARIEKLAEWYEHADDCESIATFYRQLANAKLSPNNAVIQIGWGAGWDGKTFWTHLQTDTMLFEQIVRDFRMHKQAPGSPPRKAGDPFPRSKRAAMMVKEGVAKPAAPLGWVLVGLKESP